MTKTAYHHGDLRRTLLDATLELIAERGVDGFTLREVARRAGVSHAAPYHHFADRAALVAALVEESFAQLDQAMREATESVKNARDRLARLGVAYILWAWHNPARFRVMWRPELRKCDDPSAVEQAADNSYLIVQETIRQALPPSRRTETEIGSACLAAWSSVHGFSMLLLDGSLSEEPHTEAEIVGMAEDLVGRTVSGVLSLPRH